MGDKKITDPLEIDQAFIDYQLAQNQDSEVLGNILPAQLINECRYGVLMNSDQSINNNNIFIKNGNDTNNVEDEIDPEEINTSLITIFSDRFVFDKKHNDMMKQINELSIEAVQKESSITITETTPRKSLAENNYIQGFTINQSINQIKTVDSMIHNRLPELKNYELKLTETIQNICKTCNTIDKSRVPICVWSQDDNNIYLSFNILKIDNFRVNCTMQSITFKAQYKDVSYTFCVMLYGFIKPKITHTISVEGIRIKARKLYRGKNDNEWPRLFACKKIHNYVKHYDTKCIETKELGIWTKALNWFKMILTGTMELY